MEKLYPNNILLAKGIAASWRLNRWYAILCVVVIVSLLLYSHTSYGQRSVSSTDKGETKTISGVILDQQGLSVVGATVGIKGEKKRGVTTNAKGAFVLNEVRDKDILLISFIGFKTKEVLVGDKRVFSIKLQLDAYSTKDVVVTGIFERKKESFTGTTATFTGQQLRTVGNQNVIQSLRTLDPSFALVTNNLSGSNPNALATIELRGKTSINSNLDNYGIVKDQLAVDPNQPLFILDGFESSLQQVTDLDMNRIASITILKDAASTAIYGSRSANGVIVIETIKPKPGQLIITYTGDFNVDIANLRDYNLMNAAQKLEFERLSGRFISPPTDKYSEVYFEQLYNQRLKAVKEGVNTYWLNVPLRTGITQKHSLYASGGSNEFLYGVGIDYQDIGGVMKGSDRNNWSARVDLTYRVGKVNVSDKVFINGITSHDSPYGSFTTYAAANPYYKKDVTGPYFETLQGPGSAISSTQASKVPNPLYNASLNSKNSTSNLSLQNNLMFTWDINAALRLSGGLQLSKTFGKVIKFISPEDTYFDQVTLLEKGSYTESNTESFSYDANIMATYNKVFKKNVLTVNIRADAHDEDGSNSGFTGVGFPVGVDGNASFAYQYKPDSKPDGSIPPTIRRVSALASANYVYDNRYFVDATYRIDGATVFGSDNKYSTFWSAGIGWSIQHEKFLSKAKWVDLLTLRLNVGSTGNQQLGSFASATVYNLKSLSNIYGQGYFHTSLGNPDLQWQKTLQTNIGLDFSLFNKGLSGSVNAYDKHSNPLVIALDLPGSNGIADYPTNIGYLDVRGVDGNVLYNIINNLNKRIVWSVGLTASIYRSRYGGFNNTLNTLNAEEQKSNSILQYKDGRSPDDIWLVPSLGIDPGNGKELFLKQDGTYTYDYDPEDLRVVGSLRPAVDGVISTSFRLRGLTLGAFIRYTLGTSIVNTALYNKVENISFLDLSSNQDVRALESRWKKPGDLAEFRGISLTDNTPLSSRFVEKENLLSGESFTAGYEFLPQTANWMKHLGLKSLRLTAYLNNIFRLSNIRVERGIDYPFANTISGSISALF